MPWVIQQEGVQFCVYRQVNGQVTGLSRGRHSTRREARQQLEALYAVERPSGAHLVDLEALIASGAETLVPWTMGLIPIGVKSDDRRVVDPGVTARPGPLPLWSQLVNAGHETAPLVGRIDRVWTESGMVMATGVIDTALDYADQTIAALRSGSLGRVSMDPAGGSVETEILAVDSETGEVLDWVSHYQDLVVGGATIVGIPAWGETWIRLDEPVAAVPQRPALVAAGDLDTSERPPLHYFDNPVLPGRTRTQVSEPDENGHRRVFGHLAPWGECHIGIQNRCQQAPRSATNYGWYLLGTLRCAEGCTIPIGTIVMDSGHAPRTATATAACSYYDQTGWAVADVTVGEDDHGIWFSGALRRGLTEDQVRAFGAARLSGDWRPTNGSQELVAVAAVNLGGFPVYEQAVAADGSVQSLIWAPEFEADPVAETTEARRHLVGLLTERVFQL